MALKVGETEVSTSIASLAQRRGVTPAYEGDALGTALSNIGETIDVFQKRAAELLDVEYRSKAVMDATNKISEYEKEFRLDPEAFIKKSEAYLKESISQAPQRYKGWMRGMLSPKIAQTGDVIWSRWNNIQQQEKKKLFQESHITVMEDMRNVISNLDVGQLDEYIVGTDGKGGIALQNLGEGFENYSKLYNSLDPQYRSDMLMPDEWLSQQKLYIEGIRMESVIMSELEAAAASDLSNYYNNPTALGFKQKDLDFNKQYLNMMNVLDTYIKNPNVIKTDNHKSSILTSSTEVERATIVDTIKEQMKNAKSKSDAAFTQYSNFQKINADRVIDDITLKINGFDYSTLERDKYSLADNLAKLGMEFTEIEKVLDAHDANKLIYNNVLTLSENPDLTNLNNIAMTTMAQLSGLKNSPYSDSDEVKQGMIDAMVSQEFRPVIQHTITSATGPEQLGYTKQEKINQPTDFFDINSIDLFEVNELGELKYGNEMGKINTIISAHNHIPSVVKHAFGNAAYLQINNPLDFATALELGKLATSISNRNYMPDNLSQEQIMQIDNWASFYKKYNALDLTNKDTKDVQDAAESYLTTMTNPNSNNFYSAVTNNINTNFGFNLYDLNENQINIGQILKDKMKNPETHDKQLLAIFGSTPKGDVEINNLLEVLKDPFMIVLTNDIKNHYADRNIDILNVTNADFILPTEFTTNDYVWKTMKKAMKIRNYDGWSLM